MSTNVTLTNDPAVEYYGVSHIQSMTQSASDLDETSSENSPQKAQRDENGKLLPGCTGLPGAGRPKGSGLVSDAIKQALREGKAEEVKETLFNLMAAADKDSVRLAAISEIVDRSEGKAIQSIRHAGVFMVAAPSAEAIAALDGWAGDE